MSQSFRGGKATLRALRAPNAFPLEKIQLKVVTKLLSIPSVGLVLSPSD